REEAEPSPPSSKISVTNKEYQEGRSSLLIEKVLSPTLPANKSPAPPQFYTDVTNNSLIRPTGSRIKTGTVPEKTVYSFGGWVKSDPFKKSLSGYKISWFDKEHQPVREDFTDLVSGAQEWKPLFSTVGPPSEAVYGKFSCVVLGTSAVVYFDNVSVSLSTSDSLTAFPRADKLSVNNDSFTITALPSGIWRLEDYQGGLGGIQLDGELSFRQSNIESKQSFYSKSKITKYVEGDNFELATAMLNPLLPPPPLQFVNINIGVTISPTPSINYHFPSDLYGFLRNKDFSLISTLSIENIRCLKLISSSGIQERSIYDDINEKMINGINLYLPHNIISINYSQPIDFIVRREGDILSFIQTFQSTIQPSGTGSMPSEIVFGLQFGLKSITQNQADWERMLNKAKDFEGRRNLGEAIELYRSLLLDVSQASSDIVSSVKDRLEILESKAGELLENNSSMLFTARLLKDYGLYNETLKMAEEISRVYKNTDYSDKAKTIILQIKTEVQQMKKFEDDKNAEKILSIANGYLKEKQNNLALFLYQIIVQRYPGTELSKEAKENIQKIESK
ncbi:MAG: hypothetical protein QME51_05060, partial [Planctomycetota bacterium]|nr:hypothetical protein [Planctomycetota bacterium]MDI6787720.1 hypothetical protein [Planctomycetota bacterium]